MRKSLAAILFASSAAFSSGCGTIYNELASKSKEDQELIQEGYNPVHAKSCGPCALSFVYIRKGDNIEAKDENGNIIDTRKVDLDITSGYGIFTDASGNLNLKLKAKPGDAFHPTAKDVIVRLDDRTTFGKKLLQDAYSQSKQMFEATGDSQYEQLADEIETTLLNNTENIITSFNDNNKMRTVQNKIDLLQPGSTWTYAQVSPDGSSKIFYSFTSLGNKTYDVKLTDGKNDITDGMLGEHEPVSSPQEVYKLMQRQNGRK